MLPLLLPLLLPPMLPPLRPVLLLSLPLPGVPPAAGAPIVPESRCPGGTPVREAESSLRPGVRPPSREAASSLRPGVRAVGDCCCCIHDWRAEPLSPSHEVVLLVVPALLPLPAVPLREPVLLPLPVPVAEPLAEPLALPLADPLAEPPVVPPVLSAPSDTAEKASDTAAATASNWCLVVINAPFEKKKYAMGCAMRMKQEACRACYPLQVQWRAGKAGAAL
jgi:hypothetical protein